jgi:hypothetical protein
MRPLPLREIAPAYALPIEGQMRPLLAVEVTSFGMPRRFRVIVLISNSG